MIIILYMYLIVHEQQNTFTTLAMYNINTINVLISCFRLKFATTESQNVLLHLLLVP